PLVESLRNEVVCAEHDIARYIPDPPDGLMPLDLAIGLALRHVRAGDVATRWSSAFPVGAPTEPLRAIPGRGGPRAGAAELGGDLLPSDPQPSDPAWSGGSLYTDDRIRVIRADPEILWQIIEGIGGERGWYSFPLAWAVRGLLDRAVGGVGLRRGRRDPDHLQVGDALDFWRVEEVVPGSLLRLRAEMKLPGLAWLELSVRRDAAGRTIYRQRAIFRPFGLLGQAYWWSVLPFHGIVFGGMLRNIAAAAGRATADQAAAPGPRGR
ncbi:MAG: DUF2867 domain-containing protein, partial [Streptosporangiaceae bacterium]